MPLILADCPLPFICPCNHKKDMKLVIGAQKDLATDFTSRIYSYARQNGIEVIGSKRIIYEKIYNRLESDTNLIKNTWINFHIRNNMPPGALLKKARQFYAKKLPLVSEKNRIGLFREYKKMTEKYYVQKKKQRKTGISETRLLGKNQLCNIDLFIALNGFEHAKKDCYMNKNRMCIQYCNFHGEDAKMVENMRRQLISNSLHAGIDMDISISMKKCEKAHFPVISISSIKDTLTVFMANIVDCTAEILSKKGFHSGYELWL